MNVIEDLQSAAANDSAIGNQRDRTVPIPETMSGVPGYPRKLVIYKIAASRYWQVRFWSRGRIFKKSAQTQSLAVAQNFARQFYEELLGRLFMESHPPPHAPSAAQPADASPTFGQLAERCYANEQARCQRGELSRGSVQVLRNRLDAHLLPRWGSQPPQALDFKALLDFVQTMSQGLSSTTISQYLVAVRKVLAYGVAIGAMDKLPEFPKIKIHTVSRGAFTPSEYWRLLRRARSMRGVRHPDAADSIRQNYKLRTADQVMPPDMAWAVGFMVNSFIRPSDLKTLKHRHVEVVRTRFSYLRLTLPQTKRHEKPIVTLQPAVRVYQQIRKHQQVQGYGGPEDYLFLPHLRDRDYAHAVLNFHFNWILAMENLKQGPHGQPRSMYSLRHSSITFRLLYGQGIDLLTLARNARTSVDVINRHYASTVTGEQNIGLLQSRRSQANV